MVGSRLPNRHLAPSRPAGWGLTLKQVPSWPDISKGQGDGAGWNSPAPASLVSSREDVKIQAVLALPPMHAPAGRAWLAGSETRVVTHAHP